MTDKETAPPRYLVREACKGWMVYDRQRKGPALVGTNPAVNLTRERANHVAQRLTGELQDKLNYPSPAMNGPTTILAGPPHRRTQGQGAFKVIWRAVFGLVRAQEALHGLAEPMDCSARTLSQVAKAPHRGRAPLGRALSLLHHRCSQTRQR